MRALRTQRLVVRVTHGEQGAIIARARAHRAPSVATWVRATLLGHRPGAEPGTPAGIADAWWDSLPPARRAQLHGWLTAEVAPVDDLTAPLPFDTEEPAA